ncbi:hypothetical protein OG693_39840 [Streptomyces sp. NBC_01259]|uniref:hypothetical protein n=1 Tax=Streptomyces sp. NBC_01259 TaxID=2903800 RepID=UPI00324977F0
MTEISDNDAAGVQVMSDAYKRWADMPPVKLNMHRQDAFTVLMGLQAAITHPGIRTTQLAAPMEATGRAIQEAICDTPEIYAMAEAGWNRAFDVTPDDDGNGHG